MFETIVHVSDTAQARVLIAALKAHGFHPLEGDESGVPGFAGVVAPRGIPIRLPEEEAADGKVLADDLLRQMAQR
ncbi:MAG TPA: hypothetical protein VHA07_09090 [Devosia sp.]|nr:hypothetical protein [Devosia sp.]